jgi:O-antigen/teichoic acid export membrane protein
MRAGSMDRHFIRSSAAFGAANVAARALGILFSFVVAKLYAPAQFGEVRYLIALATVLVIPTNALPRTLSRFVTKHRAAGQDAADCYFSNSLVLLVASIVAVLALALVAALTLHRLSIGLFALCAGLSLFAVYFELLRSVERFYTMACFYITANIVQLVVVIAAAHAHLFSVTLVVIAYGLSSVLPFLAIEGARRSPLHFRARSLSRPVLWELTRFSLPMLLAHAAYTAWFNVDLLLVDRFLGLGAAGNYALSRTITMIFVFVPFATTTVVLPRFVHVQARNGVAYLRATLLASAATSALLLALVGVAGRVVLQAVFHHKYPMAAVTLMPLSIGMALYSLYVVLETWVIGIGRPQLHSLSMGLTMTVTLGSNLVLIPAHGQLGAGIGFLLGAATGLVALGSCAWITRPRRRAAPQLPPAAPEATPLVGAFPEQG